MSHRARREEVGDYRDCLSEAKESRSDLNRRRSQPSPTALGPPYTCSVPSAFAALAERAQAWAECPVQAAWSWGAGDGVGGPTCPEHSFRGLTMSL